jgi:SepF-like predicted cell division protein (DUF552 family)
MHSDLNESKIIDIVISNPGALDDPLIRGHFAKMHPIKIIDVASASNVLSAEDRIYIRDLLILKLKNILNRDLISEEEQRITKKVGL